MGSFYGSGRGCPSKVIKAVLLSRQVICVPHFAERKLNTMAEKNHKPIWTRIFILLCLAQFLGYGHHALLTPTLPLYLTHLGGSPFLVGLMLGAFSVCSILTRPVMGYWVDSWSDTGVMTSGCAFLAASVLIFIFPFIGATFLASSLRGIAWSGLNTGGYSFLSFIVPPTRRGEAAGFYSGIQSSATIFFPAVALWIIDLPLGGFAVVFLVSSGVALVGAGLSVSCKRWAADTGSLARRDPVERESLPGTSAFVDRSVLFAATLLLCVNLSYSATTYFLVLYTRTIGLENLGWYFVAIGCTSLVARPLLGWASDRIGRGPAVAAGFVLEGAGLFLIMVASDLALIIVAGVLYFLGSALGVSTTMALAIERSDPQRRGVTMATFSVAFPLGSGFGAMLSGGLIEIAGYKGMYLAEILIASAGLLFTLVNWSRLSRPVNR